MRPLTNPLCPIIRDYRAGVTVRVLTSFSAMFMSVTGNRRDGSKRVPKPDANGTMTITRTRRPGEGRWKSESVQTAQKLHQIAEVLFGEDLAHPLRHG